MLSPRSQLYSDSPADHIDPRLIDSEHQRLDQTDGVTELLYALSVYQPGSRLSGEDLERLRGSLGCEKMQRALKQWEELLFLTRRDAPTEEGIPTVCMVAAMGAAATSQTSTMAKPDGKTGPATRAQDRKKPGSAHRGTKSIGH